MKPKQREKWREFSIRVSIEDHAALKNLGLAASIPPAILARKAIVEFLAREKRRAEQEKAE